MKGWLLQLPAQYHQRAHNLFNRHGLTALLIGRFLGFVRTLLPTMAGISGLNSSRFRVFNWLSAAIWVCALVGLGYAFSQIPLVKRYESGDDRPDAAAAAAAVRRPAGRHAGDLA